MKDELFYESNVNISQFIKINYTMAFSLKHLQIGVSKVHFIFDVRKT
jgi:hypothetical protein